MQSVIWLRTIISLLSFRMAISGTLRGTFGYRPSDVLDQCRRIVGLIGMQGKEHTKAETYSKGMIQRFGLGAALIGSPKLLILDEPTSGLDPIGIREIRQLLESLKKQGMTIFLNSHLLLEVEKICDNAAIINNGRLLVKDTISALVKDGDTLEDVFVRFVKVDMKMPKTLPPVIRIAKYTITDEARQRSFVVMSVICAVFIFLVRGCYHGDYMVNGQELDAGKIVIMVSKITFHVIAVGVIFLAAMGPARLHFAGPNPTAWRRRRPPASHRCDPRPKVPRRRAT